MYIEFDIPELMKLPESFPNFWLNRFFRSSLTDDFQINALTSTYFRLAEAAHVEYEFGRLKLQEFWTTHSEIKLSAMNRSVSHFESCVFDTHRAIACARRLRRHRKLPSSLCETLKTNKPAFVSDAIASKIRIIRDEILHFDDILMKDNFQESQFIGLRPDGPEVPHATEEKQTVKTIDRLVFGNNVLRFSELATWLNELGDFATTISSWEASAGVDRRSPEP